MKKSIVALAVSSAALASVSAYAAEDTSVDFYGNIQYAYTSSTSNGTNFEDNGSTLGVKGESKVNDDITAFFKYELEFRADEQDDRGGNYGYNESHLDQAYVGLKGDFGKVTVGTHDTIYNNAIQDAVDQMENLSIDSADGSSQGDTITYFSPSMSGFEVQVALQTKGTNTKATTNASTGDTEYSGNAGMAVLKYSNDLVSVALGYDSRENTAADDAKSTSGMAVTVTPMDNLSLTAKYETTEDTADYLGLAARYGYGMGDVYGSYTNVNPDSSQTDNESYNVYAAGVTYSINSSMYTYFEIGNTGSAVKDEGSNTTSVVGVTYVF
ncbi:porin [Marinomonas arenicola]|uniref:porin n=1 Tax=Marinomonas TaxID=28253 RepID=UPI0010553647|nr:porin [Marinomonas sp. KMM3893]